ncbi:MAG: hypothetical protein IIW30_03020, partial [Flavobacteriales bacterium]|nr:hypothetical protein [Flavobacteriales bacterium]
GEVIDEAIRRTEEFFRSLGLTTRLTENKIGEETICEIERRFTERGAAYGEAGNVNGVIAAQILRSCI